MKNLKDFSSPIDFVLTDIDDTLTDDGLLEAAPYAAMWRLHHAGVRVVPITGRPAGWCEMIARQWPVAGVVGENGGFYFRYHERKMRRTYHFEQPEREANRRKLERVRERVLREVPGCAIASDQFCREMDLAVDFREDVTPLPAEAVDKIVRIFEEAGAVAKVSSIHVNGWFGDYDKRRMALRFLKDEFGLSEADAKVRCAFCGDSPNDEPMFAAFPHSFGVANIADFRDRLRSPPTYIANARGGAGFTEIADRLLACRTPSTK